jgi:ABC-type dipeptide/oligopeptide/nickel transport system ATPase component
MPFQKASKSQAKARIGLIGPAGSGKTYTALRIASALGAKIAVIDTEHGSASKYADEFAFDTLQLTSFHPQRYVEAIEEAGQAGYDVLIIDSASHEWNGQDGCLELAEQAAARYKGNKWAGWRDVTPLHNRFVEALLAAPLHLIVTYRSKMEYIQSEAGNGKTEIKKVGMAAIAREGAEYELDIVGEFDLQHRMVITKTRCKALTDQVIDRPGDEFAGVVQRWLTDGDTPPVTPITEAQVKAIWQEAQRHMPPLDVAGITAFANTLLGTAYANPRALSHDEAERVLDAIKSDTGTAQQAAG